VQSVVPAGQGAGPPVPQMHLPPAGSEQPGGQERLGSMYVLLILGGVHMGCSLLQGRNAKGGSTDSLVS
jgi:hypothetical protein